MSDSHLLRLLQGNFRFFQPEADDLDRISSNGGLLPSPQRIFLENEEATPVLGFPVLMSSGTRALREALEAWVVTEEELELEVLRGHHPDRRSCEAAWSYYRKLLGRATENMVSSSFGRGYPDIFWLYHSIAASRLFKELPRRLRRRELELGKAHGDEIKYRIFHRYLDRVINLTYEKVQHTALESEEEEKEHFPPLLARMRDNALILTEDHISPDLAELDSYLGGYLRIEGREFRSRLQATVDWHTRELERDPELRGLIVGLLQIDHLGDPHQLFCRPGYVRFLAKRPSYSEDTHLPEVWREVWESLLLRLKEFEVLAALRRYVVPIYEDGERFKCSAAAVRRSLTGKGEIYLSGSTRPLDFMTPWVVDPLVRRFGLVYDITDFSAVISVLRRSGSDLQDQSFRKIFSFQRRINRMAREHRLQLEKYLGDGALYSGRYPSRLLAVAIHVQRTYQQALEEDFPFDRGMRIALNYGRYRLLPIEGGGASSGHRYEFFGHGIVELSRLVTGKTMREIDDVKNLLVSQGYDQQRVDAFFAPVTSRDIYLLDKIEKSRPFYAYVNPSGVLVNEGIVATEQFISQVGLGGKMPALHRFVDAGRRYVLFEIDEGSGPILVGIRKLGAASLKGLGKLDVFEVVDGEAWRDAGLKLLSEHTLLRALDAEFSVAARVEG
jgi:hypothetical protein